MIDAPMPFPTSHPNVSYWLDAGAKLAAVILGAFWTVWNFLKSRTYRQKLDLQITGEVFREVDLYVTATITLKNLGAAKHVVQPEGTSCEIKAISNDLTVRQVRLFSVFTLQRQVEPGESITDTVLWRMIKPEPELIWLRINLRVVSGSVEWNTTSLVRVKPAAEIKG